VGHCRGDHVEVADSDSCQQKAKKLDLVEFGGANLKPNVGNQLMRPTEPMLVGDLTWRDQLDQILVE